MSTTVLEGTPAELVERLLQLPSYSYRVKITELASVTDIEGTNPIAQEQIETDAVIFVDLERMS